MASLIKNQILKHLSKFTKNLSPDKLQLSTFKGHCELQNLELDEVLLMEFLELPTWLCLTRAVCNQVSLKIHWTKLKSSPIQLYLDEVLVEVETCEDLRPLSPTTAKPNYMASGKYGMTNRVIDGMTVLVNSVVINFKSPAFEASFQLSRLVVESRTPRWEKGDLRLCRIKNPDKEEVLVFKQLQWQFLRIEAKARNASQPGTPGAASKVPVAPLRLITNPAFCRIVTKKKITDSSVLGRRLVFILDGLLWALTDAQLIAALHFVDSISSLIQRATQVTQKVKAVQKLQAQQNPHQANVKNLKTGTQTPLARLYNHYDVVESSFHFFCSKIDLHLCDDMDPHDGRSSHPLLKDGAALQIVLERLLIDYYPYHQAMGSRDHWIKYSEASTGRSAWVQQLLNLYSERLQKLNIDGKFGDLGKFNKSKHTTLHQASPHGDEAPKFGFGTDQGKRPRSGVRWLPNHLMSSCCIIRLEEFVIYEVSTSSKSKSKHHNPQKFLGSDKSSLVLPGDMKSIHIEYTYYYFPGDIQLPVPGPYLYAHLGPIMVKFDIPTVLWANAFFNSVQKCMNNMKVLESGPRKVAATRIEALLPRIIIPADKEQFTQPERPVSLHLLASRIIATNCRIGDHASALHLNQCLESLSGGPLFFEMGSYPWKKNDVKPICERFIDHCLGRDNQTDDSSNSSPDYINPTSISLSESQDIWSIHLDPWWAEFVDSSSARPRPQTFIDPLPLTLWFYNKKDEWRTCTNNCSFAAESSLNCRPCLSQANKSPTDSSMGEADVYLLLHVHSILNIQMNHYQYVFLMRALDMFNKFEEQFSKDVMAIRADTGSKCFCVTTLWPCIEVSLVLRHTSAPAHNDEAPYLSGDLMSDCDLQAGVKLQESVPSSVSGGTDSASKENMSLVNGNALKEEKVLPKSLSDSYLDSHCSVSSASLSEDTPLAAVEKHTEIIHKGFQTSTSAVKRGFTNIMASIDMVMTKGSPSGSDTNPNEMDAFSVEDDTISVRSDFSSDSDQFVAGLETSIMDDDLFHTKPETVEVADEVKEGSFSEPATTISDHKNEIISVVTSKIGDAQMVLWTGVSGSTIIFQSQDVALSENRSVSREDFQSKFSSKSRGWQNSSKSKDKSSDSLLSLRLEKPKGDIKSAILRVLLKGLSLQLSSASLAGMAEMIEDEVVSEILPLRVLIDDLCLNLKGDRPNTYPASPQAPPMVMNFPHCLIDRTSDGILYVMPVTCSSLEESVEKLLCVPVNVPSSSKEEESQVALPEGERAEANNLSLDINHLIRENEQLRRKLYGLRNLQKENELLREQLLMMYNSEGENNLRRQLLESQDEVRRLEEEKNSLLATMQVLQVELDRLELERREQRTGCDAFCGTTSS